MIKLLEWTLVILTVVILASVAIGVACLAVKQFLSLL